MCDAARDNTSTDRKLRRERPPAKGRATTAKGSASSSNIQSQPRGIARSSCEPRLLGIWALWLACFIPSRSPAEIPLPPQVVYGQIGSEGPVIGTIQRGGQTVLEIPGETTRFQGTLYYVLRIPMETRIGAPGPAGNAAREGDVLRSISVDGVVVTETDFSVPLTSAGIAEVPVQTAEGFVRSDCDGSGSIDLTDAIFNLNHLFLGGPASRCKRACDADGNADLDLTDPIYTLNFLFLGGPRPPAPYPACGERPSALTCESYDACPKGGGGGYEEPAIAGGPASPAAPKADARSPDGRTRKQNGSAAFGALIEDVVGRMRMGQRGPLGLGVFDPIVEVSPSSILFGEVSEDGEDGAEKSLSIVNRSGGSLGLELKSLSAAFSVSPRTLQVPEGGSVAAFVRAEAASAEADAPVEPAAVEIVSEGKILARIEILHEEPSRYRAYVHVRAGDVQVAAGSEDKIAVPVEASASMEASPLSITFQFAPDRFQKAEFVPPAGLEAEAGATAAHGALSVTFRRLPSAEGLHLGHVVLTPAGPLPAGTYPVTVLEATALASAGAPLAVVPAHGEVLSLKPWLDLDGDGEVLASFELVLARRHFLGGEGIDRLWPEVWGSPGPENAGLPAIVEALERCSALIDVDGSAAVGAADFLAITRSLSGFKVPDRDVSARVRNLHLPLREATSKDPVVETPAEGPTDLILSACVLEEGSFAVRASLREEPALELSSLSLALKYPYRILALRQGLLPEGAGETVELHVEDSEDSEGTARILLIDVDGEPFARTLPGEVLFTLTFDPQLSDSNGEDPGGGRTVDARVEGAYLGPARRVLRTGGLTAGLTVGQSSTKPCPGAVEDCAREVKASGEAGIFAVLEYLFSGGPAPHCLEGYDWNGDGAVDLSDAVALIAELGYARS